ncbi:4-sulfomuconolactone hydrolase [Anatilimnocola aggregata]|uniref:4-sulfomuconolactone hydrolase n=2 Tax=Anatilimnocola aggregata TaxID=2528021 RepID=A0A517YMW1_9BACT|nr:4-sulfomuconolactone hydrolase [Anatilimnocola aggregata]
MLGSLPVSAIADEKFSEHPLIDAHSHVWSPDTDKWPLAGGKTKADLDPPSFTPEELLKLAHPERVGRVVLIQHHTYHSWDNSYLIDCAARMPGTFAVTGMLDDTQANPAQQMRPLLEKRVRGFRITSWLRKEKWLSGDGMAAMWRTGAETGQAMCCLINPEDLPGVDAICAKHPDTTVVIDHFARIGVDGEIRSADLKNLLALAKHKRVNVKLSAYYALGKKQEPYEDLLPMIRQVLTAFGPDRCMWASDAPYQVVKGHTYGASIALLRDRAGLSAGDKEHLFRKTAERIYFS